MKKTILAVILLLTLCLNIFAMASCSPKNNKTADFVVPEEGFDTTTPVTITFYHTMGQNLRDVLDRYVVEFNKLYPNITVDHQQVGGYDDVRDQIKIQVSS